MLVAKLFLFLVGTIFKFENYVNYAGSKTKKATIILRMAFENYVNYAGSKTKFLNKNLQL